MAKGTCMNQNDGTQKNWCFSRQNLESSDDGSVGAPMQTGQSFPNIEGSLTL